MLRSGEHLVPEAALEALADQNIPFSIKGKATHEQDEREQTAFRAFARKQAARLARENPY